MSERQPIRTWQTIYQGDLWPDHSIMSDAQENARYQAVYTVLSHIPEEDYQRLNDRADEFIWFIPHALTHGGVFPFFATHYPEADAKTGVQLREYAAVLYLSPELERRSETFIVAVIAHELAHLCLGHRIMVGAEYEEQEAAAWELVRGWGFRKEAAQHQRYHKWLESWEQTWCRKFEQGELTR